MNIHTKKKKNGYSHTTCEINPRLIKDLNVKGKTLKILEDNLVENVHGLWAGKEFLRNKKILKIKL